MAGRWIATNSPNERTKVGYVYAGSPKPGVEDYVEHDCQPSGSSGTWTCGPCGRKWKWSPNAGFLTWGTSKRGR